MIDNRFQPVNVLLVVSHDFGPRIACYGDRQAVTPNLDRLAADGSLRFERHYAQWPLCGPSRANIWTGCRPPTTRRYDNRSSVPEFRDRMGPGFATLPEHFRRHGYVAHGVWHLLHAFELDDASWDEPCWHPALPTPQMPEFIPPGQADQFYWWVTEDAFRLVAERMARSEAAGYRLDEPRRYRGPAVEAAAAPDNAYVEGQATDAAVAWLEAYDDERPFFLGVGYEIGHLPFSRAAAVLGSPRSGAIVDPGGPADMPAGSPAWIMGDKEPAQYYWQHSYDRVWHPTYAQELELLHGHYAAMSYWDAQVGRLLDVLERKGLREETIVVVTTDHGFSDGQHGYWGKHNMWDVALHVPLILHVPGLTPSAATTQRLSEHVDLYPTLCDLCGLSTPDFVEGTSLVPLLEDPGRPWKEAVFAWRRPMYHDLHQAYHEARGMRTERYRFTDYVDSEDQVLFTELFDHAADCHETVNLALDPGNRALVAELRSLLGHGWRACIPPASQRLSGK